MHSRMCLIGFINQLVRLRFTASYTNFAQLKKHLPDEIVDIEAYLSALPDRDSVVKPWTNLVVNFNVVTKAHRDCGDKGLCGIFVIGDFKGGELCLYEPGIVLPLQSGDFVVFNSTKITHFNLHCKGWRVSFVLQSDKNLDRWIIRKNGLEEHIHWLQYHYLLIHFLTVLLAVTSITFKVKIIPHSFG